MESLIFLAGIVAIKSESMQMSALWLIALLLALEFECTADSLVSLWFAVGSLFACAFAMFDASVQLQCGIFVAVSVTTLMFHRAYIREERAKEQ